MCHKICSFVNTLPRRVHLPRMRAESASTVSIELRHFAICRRSLDAIYIHIHICMYIWMNRQNRHQSVFLLFVRKVAQIFIIRVAKIFGKRLKFLYTRAQICVHAFKSGPNLMNYPHILMNYLRVNGY